MSVQTEEIRRTMFEIAEQIAPGWERRRALVEEVMTPVRRWMIDELDPRPGETVLELAAGAGDTGFEAAARLGEDGRLLCTDFSPAMIEVAKRRGAALGVRNVTFAVMDGERIELDDDAVDGVLCRFGYMLMPDPAAALAETRRVLRPGGRVALAVWGAPERNPLFALLAPVLIERGHIPPPDPAMPTPFSLADEARLRELLEGAGFGAVRTREIPVAFLFHDVDDYLDVVADTSGPLGVALQRMPAEERDAIREALRPRLEAFAARGGVELPGLALATSAR